MQSIYILFCIFCILEKFFLYSISLCFHVLEDFYIFYEHIDIFWCFFFRKMFLLFTNIFSLLFLSSSERSWYLSRVLFWSLSLFLSFANGFSVNNLFKKISAVWDGTVRKNRNSGWSIWYTKFTFTISCDKFNSKFSKNLYKEELKNTDPKELSRVQV